MERSTASNNSKPDAKPRGFTNDGKVSSEIVNDSFGTVDPADSSGLATDADNDTQSRPDAIDGRSRQHDRP